MSQRRGVGKKSDSLRNSWAKMSGCLLIMSMLVLASVSVTANAPPLIEIIEPAHGETVSGVITIWMLAWDEDGLDDIKHVWVKIDNGEFRNATFNHTDPEGSWWYYEWDTTEVEDGWHLITAIAYDGIHDASDSIEVIVDNIPDNKAPGIEILEPAGGATVSGNVTILMCAWDPDGNDQIQDVWVTIDKGELRNATHNHTDGECSWWYYDWDTTEVEDGWHLITAIAFDGIDDAHDRIEVFVDNIPENCPPHIEIIEPAHGETVSGTITIWMIAWDEDGLGDIEDVWVKIDNGALRNATYSHSDSEGSWWFYVWNTTEVHDGWHLITAIVYDGIDDGSDSIEVFVDNFPLNSPPHIWIVEPKHGRTVKGVITILMVAWDEDGLDDIEDVWVRIDGGPLRNATYSHSDSEGSWWFYVWDTTEVEDGWHAITAVVYDGKDDGHHTIEVYVNNEPDNHPPGIKIMEPRDGETVRGEIVIWMCAWDPDGNDQIEMVWVRIDWGELRDAKFHHRSHECSWWVYEWDTTEVENGWHHITAIVWDGEDDGHDHIKVYVDNPENSAPRIKIIEPKGRDTVKGVIEIWMCAWDPDGNDQIERVWIRIDNGEMRDATFDRSDHECSWWFYEWDTTEVEDGWHHITAIVWDGEDDGHDHIEVFVDNIPENHSPGIKIMEPDHGQTVSGVVAIWMCAWDPDGNDQIQAVWVKIDNGELRNATHDGTDNECSWWFYEWDTTEVEDGWHLITAIAYDGFDDAHDSIEVYVDNIPENSPPGIVIVEPEDGATVSGVVTIWMCAWDPDGNEQIENVWVRIDHGELRNATFNHSCEECQWWFYEWDTTEVEDGWHLITATVYDGIDDGHDHIEVFVDNDGFFGLGPATPSIPPGFDPTFLVLTLVLVSLMGAFSAAAGTETVKFAFLKFIVLPLYMKMGKKDILDHFVRGEIYGYIKVHPGDNYTTIRKNLDLKNGTLTYHLGVLEREGLIKSWNKDGYKYFYSKDAKIPDDGVKNPSIYDAILKSIEDSPGISVKDIAAVTGISRQLANYHIRKLAVEGRIELERKSFFKACYPKNGAVST